LWGSASSWRPRAPRFVVRLAKVCSPPWRNVVALAVDRERVPVAAEEIFGGQTGKIRRPGQISDHV